WSSSTTSTRTGRAASLFGFGAVWDIRTSPPGGVRMAQVLGGFYAPGRPCGTRVMHSHHGGPGAPHYARAMAPAEPLRTETVSQRAPQSPDPPADATAPERVVLVGNPNVGKSALFGALTGKYVTVSNYPGTTVEVSRGWATVDGRRVEVV